MPFSDATLLSHDTSFYVPVIGFEEGTAVRIVTKWYEFDHGRIITIALGDALNNLPMLNEADYPILVHGRNGMHEPRINPSGFILAQPRGPQGCNDLLKRI